METQIVKTENFVIDNSEFISYETRLGTFDIWGVDKHPKPEQLAKCGFYLGVSANKTYCFYCGRSKTNWSPFENPWVEHAILSSTCPFLLLNRSSEATYNWNLQQAVTQPATLFHTCQVQFALLVTELAVIYLT